MQAWAAVKDFSVRLYAKFDLSAGRVLNKESGGILGVSQMFVQQMKTNSLVGGNFGATMLWTAVVKPIVKQLSLEAVKSVLGNVAINKLASIVKAVGKFIGASLGAAKERNIGVSITGTLKGPEGPESGPAQPGWTLHLSGFFRSEVGYTFEVAVPEVYTVMGELWRGTEIDLISTFFCNALFTSEVAQSTKAGKGLAQACTPQ